MPEHIVTLSWDPEACVWVATSDSIPGLVLEARHTAIMEQGGIPRHFQQENPHAAR